MLTRKDIEDTIFDYYVNVALNPDNPDNDPSPPAQKYIQAIWESNPDEQTEGTSAPRPPVPYVALNILSGPTN